MKTYHILVCDDDAQTRKAFREDFPKSWGEVFGNEIIVKTVSDIVIEKASNPAIALNDVGAFDALLLDVIWDDGRPHGIELCKLVREKFPELPIVIFSAHVSVPEFQRLIPLHLDGFLSKLDGDIRSWCFEVNRTLEDTYIGRSGRPLYREIRSLLEDGNAWRPDIVNDAASEVWRRESSREKWDGFWGCFQKLVGELRLTHVTDMMKRMFANSDLFALGVSPSMRGHLEHVLYVYFTGYVICHRLPGFKEQVLDAVKKLLGDAYTSNDSDRLWDLFQFAWIIAATLHDTGYALELSPEAFGKTKEVLSDFRFAKCNKKLPAEIAVTIDWDLATKADAAFQRVLESLGYSEIAKSWIKDHGVFKDDKKRDRVNHGVAGGAIFIERFYSECSAMASNDPVLVKFMEWAGTAMALHSLKVPGKKCGTRLSLDRDPLAFLLLLCDELQLWNRDRPDDSQSNSRIRRSELEKLEISTDRIEAFISHIPYNDIPYNYDIHADPIVKSVLKDNELLSYYLKVSPLKVNIYHSVRGSTDLIPPLELQ